jgi:hypothetical protein
MQRAAGSPLSRTRHAPVDFFIELDNKTVENELFSGLFGGQATTLISMAHIEGATALSDPTVQLWHPRKAAATEQMSNRWARSAKRTS